MRKTPEKIESLKPNEIFVFGSNPSGFHVGGGAKVALKKFGAIYGQSEGLQGQSYAIPSILPDVESFRPHVQKFICYAKKNPHLTFLVTQIGCGNAGYTPYDIAPLFFENSWNNICITILQGAMTSVRVDNLEDMNRASFSLCRI